MKLLARSLLLALLASCTKSGPDLSRFEDFESGVMRTDQVPNPPEREGVPVWRREGKGRVRALVRLHQDCPERAYQSLAGSRVKDGKIELCYRLTTTTDPRIDGFLGPCPQDLTATYVMYGIPDDATPQFVVASC